MHGSDRGKRTALVNWVFPVIGIVLATLLAWGIGYLQARETERRYHTPRAYQESSKANAERACVGMKPAAMFECVNEHADSSYEQAHAEQDLSAQQRAATIGLLSSVVSFLALIATVAGLCYVRATLLATLKAVKETSEATEAMREANKISQQAQRPWIFVRTTAVNPSGWRNNGETFRWEFVLDNKGTFPAIVNAIHGRLCLTDSIPSEPPIESMIADIAQFRPMDRPFEYADVFVINAGGTTDAINLGGGTIINNRPVPEELDERNRRLKELSSNANPLGLRWWLQGHVLYHDVNGQEYRTDFCLKCDGGFGKVTVEGGSKYNCFT